jgi:hypothetical protein
VVDDKVENRPPQKAAATKAEAYASAPAAIWEDWGTIYRVSTDSVIVMKITIARD